MLVWGMALGRSSRLEAICQSSPPLRRCYTVADGIDKWNGPGCAMGRTQGSGRAQDTAQMAGPGRWAGRLDLRKLQCAAQGSLEV